MKSELTQIELFKDLYYDKITGIFTRLVSRHSHVDVGEIAGGKTPEGYITIMVNSRSYLAHRLAWLYVYGYFPENDLDHRDQVPYHNWIDNLRETSKQCNARNTGNPKDNTSGVKGVTFDKRAGKWKAQIGINSKLKSIGLYKHFYNAVCARLAAEQCLNWSGCDSSSPAYKYVQKILKEKI